jgi:hypothetical protein
MSNATVGDEDKDDRDKNIIGNGLYKRHHSGYPVESETVVSASMQSSTKNVEEHCNPGPGNNNNPRQRLNRSPHRNKGTAGAMRQHQQYNSVGIDNEKNRSGSPSQPDMTFTRECQATTMQSQESYISPSASRDIEESASWDGSLSHQHVHQSHNKGTPAASVSSPVRSPRRAQRGFVLKHGHHGGVVQHNHESSTAAMNRCLGSFKLKSVVFALVASALTMSFYNVSLQNAHFAGYRHSVVDVEPRQVQYAVSNLQQQEPGKPNREQVKNNGIRQTVSFGNSTRDELWAVLQAGAQKGDTSPPTGSEASATIDAMKNRHQNYPTTDIPANEGRAENRSGVTVTFDQPKVSTAAIGQNETVKSRIIPRIVYVDPSRYIRSDNNKEPKGEDILRSIPPLRRIHTYPPEFSDQTQLYQKYPSNDILRMQGFDRDENTVEGYDKCVPVNQEKNANKEQPSIPWQHIFHPTCNGFHELDMHHRVAKHSSMSMDLFGLKGFWRHAWKVHNVDYLTGAYIKEWTLERIWYNPEKWETLGGHKMKKLKKNILKLAGLVTEPAGVVLKTLK